MEHVISTVTLTQPLGLFINTSSGSGESEKLLKLWQQLVPEELLGAIFSVKDTSEYDRELDRALAYCESEGTTLVVAGGDGTFNGVLTKAASRNILLGLIPTGTFNFFARSHGIPEIPEAAIEFLLSAKPVVLPLAYVNEKPFIVSVSIGLHPKVIAEREAHTRYVGRTRLAAWISGIWTIMRARHLTRAIVCSNESRAQITTPLLLINFNSAQLFGLDRRFQYKPNKLAVLWLKPRSYWGLFSFILRGVSGHVLDEQSLECEYVDDLRIEIPRKSIGVALDGELLQFKSPLEFHVEKQGFSCLLQGKVL